MYKAKIKDKKIVKGMVSVSVEFSSDNDSFVEVFQTNQSQSPNWIDEQVQRKLIHLNNLPTVYDSIEIDREVPLVNSEEVVLRNLDAKEQYQDDLRKFEKFVSAIAKGLTTVEHEEFVALKKKLVDNFKPEYLDLF